MATMVVFSNEVCSTFTAMSSRTLLSDHVCRILTIIYLRQTIFPWYTLQLFCELYCTFKSKTISYRPVTVLEGPVIGGCHISRQSAREGSKVVSRRQRSPLPLRKYAWYSVLLEAESTAGGNLVRPEGLCPLKIPMTYRESNPRLPGL